MKLQLKEILKIVKAGVKMRKTHWCRESYLYWDAESAHVMFHDHSCGDRSYPNPVYRDDKTQKESDEWVVYEEHGDFLWALDKMSKGNKVQRDIWRDTYYYKINENIYSTDCNFPAVLDIRDMQAADWKIRD